MSLRQKPSRWDFARDREEEPSSPTASTVSTVPTSLYSRPTQINVPGTPSKLPPSLAFNFRTNETHLWIAPDAQGIATLAELRHHETKVLSKKDHDIVFQLIIPRVAEFMYQRGLPWKKWKLEIRKRMDERRSLSSSNSSRKNGGWCDHLLVAVRVDSDSHLSTFFVERNDILSKLKVKKEEAIQVKVEVAGKRYFDQWTMLPQKRGQEASKVACDWRWTVHFASPFTVRSRRSPEDESGDFEMAASSSLMQKFGVNRFSKSSIRVVFSLS